MKVLRGSIAWFIATFYVVYSFTLNTAAAVFSSSVQNSLQVSAFSATMAAVAFIIGFALMQIPAGYLLDRFSLRIVVGTGVLILSIGTLIISYARGIYLYSFANFIQGLGASFSFVSVGVLLGQWFKPKLFPILFGLTQSFACILSGLLHFYFSHALLTSSWNQLYFNLSIFGFALFVLTIIFVHNPSGYKASQTSSLLVSLKKVCSRWQLWLCGISAATSFGVLLAYGGFWYLEVQKFYSVSHNQAMMIGTLIFVGIGLGTPILGWISNLLKSRVIVLHTAIVLGVIFLLSGIYLPYFAAYGLTIIKVISLLIGFLLSGAVLFYTVVSEIIPQAFKGVALSVTNTCVYILYSIMMFTPYAFTTSKTFMTTLWVLPACVLISILFMYFIKDSYAIEKS